MSEVMGETGGSERRVVPEPEATVAGDDPRLLRSSSIKSTACPNSANHQEPGIPDGYLARYEWAMTMQKTHRQTQCSACRAYVIWVPKKPRLSVGPGEERGPVVDLLGALAGKPIPAGTKVPRRLSPTDEVPF